jgi:hypothetical protein
VLLAAPTHPRHVEQRLFAAPTRVSADDHLRMFVRHSSDKSLVPHVEALIGMPKNEQVQALRRLRGYAPSSGLDGLLRQVESS